MRGAKGEDVDESAGDLDEGMTWSDENQRTGVVQPSGSRGTMAYNADFRNKINDLYKWSHPLQATGKLCPIESRAHVPVRLK